jgi:hypothetical protein
MGFLALAYATLTLNTTSIGIYPMNQQKLLQDIESLPPLAQQEAIDFIAFLKQRYTSHSLPKNKVQQKKRRLEEFRGFFKHQGTPLSDEQLCAPVNDMETK